MSYIALNIQKQTNTKKISKFTNTDKAHWLTLTHVPISHGANINRIRKIYRGLLKNAQMNGKHTTHVEYPIKCWKSNNSAKQIVIFSTVLFGLVALFNRFFFSPAMFLDASQWLLNALFYLYRSVSFAALANSYK